MNSRIVVDEGECKAWTKPNPVIFLRDTGIPCSRGLGNSRDVARTSDFQEREGRELATPKAGGEIGCGWKNRTRDIGTSWPRHYLCGGTNFEVVVPAEHCDHRLAFSRHRRASSHRGQAGRAAKASIPAGLCQVRSASPKAAPDAKACFHVEA